MVKNWPTVGYFIFSQNLAFFGQVKAVLNGLFWLFKHFSGFLVFFKTFLKIAKKSVIFGLFSGKFLKF